MRASNKLKEFSKYRIRKIVNIVSEFCKLKLGKNNQEYPSVRISYLNCNYMGLYDPLEHKITLYVNSYNTLSDLTSTLIHEWTHSGQKVLTEYAKLYKKFGYNNHPMEIEARESEKKWNRKALNFLKKNW